MVTNRPLTVLAGLSTAALAVAGLQMPSAGAAPSGRTESGVGSAGVVKSCSAKSHGESLNISVGLILGSNGRDVENVEIRATDNDESGSFDNNDVRLKAIRLTIIDEDGKKQLNNKVAPSSPGSFDVGSAGEGAGKVIVKVRWRTHHNTVNRTCTKVIN